MTMKDSDEIYPPWKILPDLKPFDPCGQGLQEDIMNTWVPFWRSLTSQQKEYYLNKWDAPEDWRDYISVCFDITDEELDEEKIYLEKIKSLEEKDRKPEKPPSFLKKIKSIFENQ